MVGRKWVVQIEVCKRGQCGREIEVGDEGSGRVGKWKVECKVRVVDGWEG